MDKEERIRRLNALLLKQKQKEREEEAKREIQFAMEPFSNQENIEVLGQDELSKIEEKFHQTFPIEYWSSRIHWKRVDKKIGIPVDEFLKLESILREKGLFTDKSVYFFFSDNAHWLRTDLVKIFDNIEDIAWFRGDRYVFSPSPKFVIEFFHDDCITIGWE